MDEQKVWPLDVQDWSRTVQPKPDVVRGTCIYLHPPTEYGKDELTKVACGWSRELKLNN